MLKIAFDHAEKAVFIYLFPLSVSKQSSTHRTDHQKQEVVYVLCTFVKLEMNERNQIWHALRMNAVLSTFYKLVCGKCTQILSLPLSGLYFLAERRVRERLLFKMRDLLDFKARQGSKVLTEIVIFYVFGRISCVRPLLKNTQKI